MALIEKVLWFVETNLDHPVSLQDMAAALGVTRFHLTRSFAEVTGLSAKRYLIRRRLTRAALALTTGQDSILQIALDAGFQGPEPFARAFRAEFGLSPRQLRQRGDVAGLALTHTIEYRPMTERLFTAPRFETLPAMVFAGVTQRYRLETRGGIPSQWDGYVQAGITVPTPDARAFYGICYEFRDDGSFAYLCGQRLAAGAGLPDGVAKVALPAGRWACFATQGHVSTMQAAWAEVYGHWLNRPDCVPRQEATVEYYPPAFDGRTGNGGYEIWVPVAG